MQNTAGEVGTNSVKFCGLLHMNTPMLADQLRPMFISSVLILDAVWKTCQERWMIETNG